MAKPSKTRKAGILVPRRTASERRPFRPNLLQLESRDVPATFTVSTLADAGAGSLRDAIDQANTVNDADTIVFAGAAVGGTIGLSTFTNLAAGTAAVPQPAGPSGFVVTSPIAIQGTGETIARTGAHILIEKPFASSIADARRMIAAEGGRIDGRPSPPDRHPLNQPDLGGEDSQ